MTQKLEQLYQQTFNQSVNKIEKLKGDGSDRTIYRLFSRNKTVIGIHGKNIKENEAFIYLTNHFHNSNLPVPKILAEDLKNEIYLEEDLGDETLFTWMSKQRDMLSSDVSETVKDMYKQVLSLLPIFQIKSGKEVDFAICYQHIEFGRESMMWDLHYFKQNSLNVFYKQQIDNWQLEKDFQKLVNYILLAPHRYFLYRDFQSRNIMIKDNKPHFIDYQSGRRGALQYDVASLLYDAKANLPQDLREELLKTYLQEAKKHEEVDEEVFMKYFYEFALIRILQALGAYGFLGIVKNKPHFLKSIPFALKNLQIILNKKRQLQELPTLRKILTELSQDEKLLEIK
jgi:aminoglycoside/choline kinase family phosphotransferase